MFKGQRVLITGFSGMIGQALVKLIKEYEPKEIVGVSLDDIKIDGVTCIKGDLTDFSFCQDICKDIDYVFSLVGIKGSPKLTQSQPASFYVPTIMCNTNMIEAARRAKVKWFLYTSSVGVYSPADIFYEDDVWKTFPSENDKFAGWAKRMGELQLEANAIQYGVKNYSIIRPANVIGPFDNFNPETAMVVPSLINRLCSGENPLRPWGDGSVVRDFVHSTDVARAMIFLVENQISEPCNIGSGEGVLLKDMVESLVKIYNNKTSSNVTIEWDVTKPQGDKVRKMDMTRLFSAGYSNSVSLDSALESILDWYLNNRNVTGRHDQFLKDGHC